MSLIGQARMVSRYRRPLLLKSASQRSSFGAERVTLQCNTLMRSLAGASAKRLSRRSTEPPILWSQRTPTRWPVGSHRTCFVQKQDLELEHHLGSTVEDRWWAPLLEILEGV